MKYKDLFYCCCFFLEPNNFVEENQVRKIFYFFFDLLNSFFDQIFEQNDELPSTDIINLETQISNESVVIKPDSDSNQTDIQENKTIVPEQIIPANTFDPQELLALESIFHDTVYFLIKSGNEENVSLAKAKVNFSCSKFNKKSRIYFFRVFGQHHQLMKINLIEHFE